MTLKNYLTVGISAFVSGAVASLATVPTSALLSEATAKPFLVGAVMAGLAAVFHLYQPAPKAVP
jgi:hypothetical protein